MGFPPTPQMSKFLDYIRAGEGNAALRARAGCGKTSTILAAVDVIRQEFPGAETVICAYNKAIEEEISLKLKSAGHTDWKKVRSSTMHSLGWGLVKSAFQLDKNAIDDKKVAKIVESFVESDELFKIYGGQITSLVSYAKAAGVGCFPDLSFHDNGTWLSLIEHFDVEGIDNDEVSPYEIIQAAKSVYKLSLQDNKTIDFDDMVLFPVIKKLRVRWPFDNVFVDEAQDLSPIRQAIAWMFVKRVGGRLFIVGDDRQAIYGFSGADALAMENMIVEARAEVFPLSVTFRCPKMVVEEAKRIVPDIEADDSAPEGVVNRLYKLPPKLADGDVILCRLNGPLIKVAYKLIKEKIPFKVEGRSVGDTLIRLCRRWKVATIGTFLNKLEDYRNKELEKHKNSDRKMEEINDRIGSLVEICNVVTDQKKQHINDVIQFIEELFGDSVTGMVVLCSYHRSKGREWPNVYLLNHDTFAADRQNDQEWVRIQNANLRYVAITRAQQQLVYLQLEGI